MFGLTYKISSSDLIVFNHDPKFLLSLFRMQVILVNALGKVEGGIGKRCLRKKSHFIGSWEKWKRNIAFRTLFFMLMYNFYLGIDEFVTKALWQLE